MNKIVFLLLLSAIIPFVASAQRYWQQQVDYTIDVTLHDPDHTLDGFVKMQYTNHSPDTLTFIWIHCWPNAYRNDRTAFSEQLLANGRTDFYFSGREKKGYINHLDFRVDGFAVVTQDHPQYIDVVRILLPHPLPPEGQIMITSPFHEKLPYNFSRGGYSGGAYQVTQWYPKPAVYDRNGWHPIPYLDQGEFYSEFGSFDVRITLPEDFTVAATGELQNSPNRQEIPAKVYSEIAMPGSVKPAHARAPVHPSIKKPAVKTTFVKTLPVAVSATIPDKTLHYRQSNIHDFAWFADRHFQVAHDTLQFSSGRTVDIYAYYKPVNAFVWKKSTSYIKDAIRFRSDLIGEYPFNVVTAADINMGSPGGMEYPTITGITHYSTGKALDLTIEHEVGHNWFYGILGTNERRYPWMDEGMNTYYDNRYEASKYYAAGVEVEITTPGSAKKIRQANNEWLLMKIPDNQEALFINTLAKERRDQAISTTSEDFTTINYDLIAYAKAGAWMQRLEDSLGTPLFDSAMQAYYRTWQFRHPYPEDFRAVIDSSAAGHHNLRTLFEDLDRPGPVSPLASRRPIKPSLLFSTRNTDRIDFINFAPAVGYNKYDKGMVGILIHNYNLPPDHFRFLLAPLYATGTHQLNGIGRLSFTQYCSPKDRTGSSPLGHGIQQWEVGLTGDRFSTLTGVDSSGLKLSGGFYKIVPSARITFRNGSPRSTQKNWVEWKTFLIGERLLDHYIRKSTDSLFYPTQGKYVFRYLNQATFNLQDDRVLYPYSATFQFQQAASFYRFNFTGNYYFNYENGGGLRLRLFGAKFGYLGTRDPGQDLSAFMPKLTAVRGSEDYTYSNYFVGRTAFEGFSSQQIMMRDGDLKIRTDLFQGLQGRSDNWVASLNLNSTLPPALVPNWLPLTVFADIGTYAAGWQNNPPTSRFLYVGGLELSLVHDIFHFYAPLLYSSDFGNQLKTVADQNTFFKKISFSIDIQNINLHKIFGNIPL